MKLSEVGESRIRGYLFVLGQSLQTFLPREVARDALREMESHIRERLDSAEPVPDEREAVERVLQELGPPLRVAQVYSAELTIDEALTTGRALPTLRALWYQATTTLVGFAVSFLLFLGYTFGVSFIAIAALKPVFPGNVGLFAVDGVPHSFGALFPAPAGAEVLGGYWVIPICLIVGLAVLVGTHRGARRFLAWWRERRRESPVLALRGLRS